MATILIWLALELHSRPCQLWILSNFYLIFYCLFTKTGWVFLEVVYRWILENFKKFNFSGNLNHHMYSKVCRTKYALDNPCAWVQNFSQVHTADQCRIGDGAEVHTFSYISNAKNEILSLCTNSWTKLIHSRRDGGDGLSKSYRFFLYRRLDTLYRSYEIFKDLIKTEPQMYQLLDWLLAYLGGSPWPLEF